MSDITTLIQQIEQLSPADQAKVAHYLDFLRWQAQQSQAQTAGWTFSFIEAYQNAAVTASEASDGMDVKMAPAVVGGQSRPALWAHPPVVGQAIIEYHVPIPQQVDEVRLQLAIGVRDGAKIDEDNLVAFGIRVNGLRIWGQQSNDQQWQAFEIGLDVIRGDIARIEFTTEALGSHQWTWVVWGQPTLIGKVSL